MASQRKVVVRQLDGVLLWGYLPSVDILRDHSVELLDVSGKVRMIALQLVKTIAYVKDFNLDDHLQPEQLGRRSYAGRPRAEGLWLKLSFADNDSLECLAPFDFAFLDSLIESRCLAVTPPDPKSNTAKLLVPRSALSFVEVLGAITPAVKRKAAPGPKLQAGLFEEVR